MSARTHAALDIGSLPRFNPDRRDPLWWGILGLVVIESTVFMTFIVSYFYLRTEEGPWPPAGVEPPPVLYPTINLFLLLGSVAAMWWAGRRAERNDQRGLVLGIGLSVLLACVVLVLRWLQFEALEFRWDEHAYGSMVWTMTGLHFFHVVATVLGTAAIGVLGALGYFGRDRRLAVVVDAMYWYFVALVWAPVYVVLYWMPRLG